jgi:UDP-glucose 4-epimerase
MRVLVTGAAGFVGSHVVDLLLKEGHEVMCLDDLSSGKIENLPKGVNFHKMNIGSWYELVAEFVDFEPQWVVHLAAQPSICDSIDNPIRDGYVNVMGSLNVIRASQKIGVKRLVFSSTSAVYDDRVFTPIEEDDLKTPNSPYGISKLAAESYVRNLMPDEGTVLRFGNVYGPRQVPLGENQVIPRMIRHFEKGDSFFIHGSGEQIRDFVYVEDVALACLMALMAEPTGIYNIASGLGHSVNIVGSYLEKVYGAEGYVWEYDEEDDPRRVVVLNINHALDEIAWIPKTRLFDGLTKTVEWWKSQ